MKISKSLCGRVKLFPDPSSRVALCPPSILCHGWLFRKFEPWRNTWYWYWPPNITPWLAIQVQYKLVLHYAPPQSPCTWYYSMTCCPGDWRQFSRKIHKKYCWRPKKLAWCPGGWRQFSRKIRKKYYWRPKKMVWCPGGWSQFSRKIRKKYCWRPKEMVWCLGGWRQLDLMTYWPPPVAAFLGLRLIC